MLYRRFLFVGEYIEKQIQIFQIFHIGKQLTGINPIFVHLIEIGQENFTPV